MNSQPIRTFSDDEGFLHTRSNDFGKSPMALIHDTTITDGAKVLYPHMHWRYGSNCTNREGRKSMGDYFDVSETTITNRVNELVARDWVITIPRTDEHGKTHNFYHVFELQEDCILWRQKHNLPKGSVDARSRKSRKGIGGSTTHKIGSSTQVDQPVVPQLKLINPVNLSSYDPDSLESDSDSSPNGDHEKSLFKGLAVRVKVNSGEWYALKDNPNRIYCGRTWGGYTDIGLGNTHKLPRNYSADQLNEAIQLYKQDVQSNPVQLKLIQNLQSIATPDNPVYLGCPGCNEIDPCHCDVIADLINLPRVEIQAMIDKLESSKPSPIGEKAKATPFKGQKVETILNSKTPRRPRVNGAGDVEMTNNKPRDLVWDAIFTDFLDCDLENETHKKTMGGWCGSLKAILIDCLPDISAEETKEFVLWWKENDPYAKQYRDEKKIRAKIGEWSSSTSADEELVLITCEDGSKEWGYRSQTHGKR